MPERSINQRHKQFGSHIKSRLDVAAGNTAGNAAGNQNDDALTVTAAKSIGRWLTRLIRPTIGFQWFKSLCFSSICYSKRDRFLQVQRAAVDHYESMVDIRNLINVTINQRILLQTLLSKHQASLFMSQRTRAI